jgi:hypothetical protein
MRCFFYRERVRREMSREWRMRLSKRNLCVLNPGAINHPHPKGRETLASCDKEMRKREKDI